MKQNKDNFNMPDNTLSLLQRIEEYGLIGYAWMLIVILWGATARYLIGLNGKKATFLGWLTETTVCAFVGVVVGMVCQYYGMDILLTTAVAAIAAHNGTKSLSILTQVIKKNTASIEDIQIEPQTNARLNSKKEK
jgi:hypothetical protein